VSVIIPRWKWRIFGSHFGDAEMRLKALGAVTFRSIQGDSSLLI
jgi:hypothetical protein